MITIVTNRYNIVNIRKMSGATMEDWEQEKKGFYFRGKCQILRGADEQIHYWITVNIRKHFFLFLGDLANVFP